MKIGILTVPFNNNYGGFLQAFALKSVFVGMGHEVVFINRRRNRSETLRSRVKRFLLSLHLVSDPEADHIKRISVNTDRFISQYLSPITKAYFTDKQLKRCLRYRFDCFVVGSDQVWRYQYAKESIPDFFFSFLRDLDLPRFSYAASMGTDEMEYPIKVSDECADLLQSFISVSVRERSSAILLKRFFRYDSAKVVLDPVFLLPRDSYSKLAGAFQVEIQDPFVFKYILDNSSNTQEIVLFLKNKLRFPFFEISAQTGDVSQLQVLEPVEKWLAALSRSVFVITDSFHGTVFSILFNKPFWVIANKQRGISRLKDLLGRFHLEDRLIASIDEIHDRQNDQIVWSEVNKILEYAREESLRFIIDSLSKVRK